MTLEAWSWLAIFVIGGGFLVTAAYIFERAQPDPISDKRNQAHPFRRSGDPSTARPEVPLRAGVRLDGSPDLRERITGTAPVE